MNILQILHAATNIVPSNVVLTSFQVLSRVMLVCGVLLATPNAIHSPGLPLALFAWSITEIIRYGFYAFNLLNIVPSFWTFLRYSYFKYKHMVVIFCYVIYLSFRYTTFIVLYPTGVTGELLCLYWAQSYAYKYKIWSIEFPNTYNFTFSYFYFLWLVILLYIPLFPQLYMHMFALRKKVLNRKENIFKTKSN